MKLSLILEAIDKMTAPVRKATGAVSSLDKSMDQASKPVARLSAATTATGVAIGRLAKPAMAAANAVDRVGGSVSKASSPMARLSGLVTRTTVDHERLGKMATRTGEAIGTGLRRIGIGIIFAAGALSTLPVAFASAVVQAGMKYDKGFANKVTAVTSKLQMTFMSFLLNIGQAGVFDMIVSKLQLVSAWIDRMAANGSLARWANQIGQALTSAGQWLSSIDWPKVAADIFGVAKAIFAVGQFLATLGGGGLSGLFNVAIVAIIAKVSIGLYSVGAALGVVSIAGAPLWAVVGVIGALAAGAFLVWRNWDSVKAGIAGAWDWIKVKAGEAVDGITGFFSGMWGGIKSAFSAGVAMLWNGLPLWFRGIITGASFVVRAVTSAVNERQMPSGAAPRPARGATPRIAPVSPLRPLKMSAPLATSKPSSRPMAPPGNATVTLHVTSDRGVKVQPTKIAAKEMDVYVNRGRMMGPFA